MNKLIIEESLGNGGTEVKTGFVSPHAIASLHFGNFRRDPQTPEIKFYNYFTINCPNQTDLEAIGDFILSYAKQLRHVKKGF